MKKLVSLITAIAMLLSLCTVTAVATDTPFALDTDGETYLISTAEELMTLAELSNGTNYADYVSRKYKLTADIDMTDKVFPGIAVVAGSIFSGTFDGNYHVISNITINNAVNNFEALFGKTGSGAVIKNLGMKAVNLTDTTKGSECGAFVGRAVTGITEIDNSFADGVTMDSATNTNATRGGMVGSAVGTVTITNSYAKGLTGAYRAVVGDSGTNTGVTLRYVYAHPHFSNSYYTVKNLVTYSDATSVRRIYHDTEGAMNVTANYTDNPGEAGLSQVLPTLNAADLANPVFKEDKHNENGGFPLLSWQKGAFEGEGTEASPYLIKTADDLMTLAEKSNLDTVKDYEEMHYKLTADINMTGKTFPGIAVVSGRVFSGTFDGNYHVISNITINNAETAVEGLFGKTGDGAVIKNLGMKTVELTETASSSFGAIVGRAIQGTTEISNSFVDGVTIHYEGEATDASSPNRGGMVGEVNATVTISNSYVKGSTKHYRAVVGDSKSGAVVTFRNVYSQSNFYIADSNVENLVMYTSAATVHSIYTSGKMSDKNRVENPPLADALTALNGAGAAKPVFVEDFQNVNGGYPLLAWQMDAYVWYDAAADKVMVENHTGDALAAAVVVAAFNGNQMTGVYAYDNTGIAAEGKEISSTAYPADTQYRVFVWDSLTGLAPKTPVYTFSK